MARNTIRYGLDAVNNYINKLPYAEMEIIEGCLLDTLVVYHDGIIEVFEEKYLNEWSSCYIRHIYRKGLPKRFVEALEEQYRIEDERDARRCNND